MNKAVKAGIVAVASVLAAMALNANAGGVDTSTRTASGVHTSSRTASGVDTSSRTASGLQGARNLVDRIREADAPRVETSTRTASGIAAEQNRLEQARQREQSQRLRLDRHDVPAPK